MTRLRLLAAMAALGCLALFTGCDKVGGSAAAAPVQSAGEIKNTDQSAATPQPGSSPIAAQGTGQWVTVQGQVLLPKATALPAPRPLKVSQDQEHCLSKGPINADDLIVNPKNRGVKNVWVYLRPDSTDRDAKL